MERFASPYHGLLFYVVKTLHLSITFFVVFAWLCPDKYILMAHAVLVPLLILHWKTYNDRCVLSDVEAWLAGIDIEAQEDSPFIRWLLRLFTRREFQERTLAQITYGVVGVTFCISGLRLLIECFAICRITSAF